MFIRAFEVIQSAEHASTNLAKGKIVIGLQILKRKRSVSLELARKFLEIPVANVSDCMSRMSAGGPRLRPMHDVDLTQDLTTSGAFLGSPVYMSPEQIRHAKQADARVDAWALCVTLYKLLCGRTPHLNETGLGELLITICCARAPSVQRYAPWVPPALAAILQRGLDLSIDKRFRDIEELGAALRALLPGGVALAASDFRSLTEGEKATLQTPIETSTTRSERPGDRVFDPQSETATSRAVTTTPFVSHPHRPIPSARKKRLMLAMAVAAGVAAGAAGIVLVRSSVRSSSGARSTSASSAAVGIVQAGAGSPVEVALERTVKVRVGPDLVVEEGNVTLTEEDSAITLRGALGSVHALRVRRGELTATIPVVITDSGPLPSTIDLPAAVLASSSASSNPKSKPAAPVAKISPPPPARSATVTAAPKTGAIPSKTGSLERWE